MNELVDDLATAKRALDLKWDETRDLWRDAVRERFERDYWLPVDRGTRRTLEALEKMARTLNKMEREVP